MTNKCTIISQIITLCVSTLSCHPQEPCNQYLTAVSKLVWHVRLLCVQCKAPDDRQRNCPKYVEFYSKNKFEKFVHLVGFIIRIYHDARLPERRSKRNVFCLLAWGMTLCNCGLICSCIHVPCTMMHTVTQEDRAFPCCMCLMTSKWPVLHAAPYRRRWYFITQCDLYNDNVLLNKFNALLCCMWVHFSMKGVICYSELACFFF